jgi:nucleoid-associated protein YgaU
MAQDGEGDEADFRAIADATVQAMDLEDVEADVEALLADPTLKELIEQAIAPYMGVLTPAALEEARRDIAVHFIADPTAARALEEARAVAKSRVVTARTPEALRLAAERAAIAGGGKRSKL